MFRRIVSTSTTLAVLFLLCVFSPATRGQSVPPPPCPPEGTGSGFFVVFGGVVGGATNANCWTAPGEEGQYAGVAGTFPTGTKGTQQATFQPTDNSGNAMNRWMSSGVTSSQPWASAAIVGSSLQITFDIGAISAASGNYDVDITVSGTEPISGTSMDASIGRLRIGILAPPNNPDPGPCNQCEGVAGQPINLSTGNTWIQHKDYAVPGLGGGIVVTRTWNSIWSNISPLNQIGMFGDSWISSYEERLDVSDSTQIKYWRADGGLWFFQFNTALGAYQLTSPPDAHASMSFNSNTSVYTVVFADGTSKLFNNIGFLTAFVDRNGNSTTVIYDSALRLSKVTSAGNQSLTFNYPNTTSPLVQSIQDSTGVFASYTYDGSSHLTRVTYADSSFLGYAYDTSGQILSVTDTNGKTIESHTYDASRRGLTSQKANGIELVTVSYPSSTQTTLMDSMSNSTTYGSQSISSRKFISSISGPGCASCGGGNTNTYGYDSNGNRTTATDANGNTTTSTYDATGNVLTRSNTVAGSVLTWAYTYNSFSEILTATDPLGHTTTNTYDTHGNLLTTTTPSPDGTLPGSTTTFTFNTKGQMLTITDPLNNKTTLAYTTAGLVASITDAQNNKTSFGYDARGNRTSLTDALTKKTSFAYDLLNRLTKITYPDSSTTQFAYDTRGRRTTLTDGNSEVTTYSYDDADRLVSVKDAANNTTTYGYDTESNLTSITDANHHLTMFQYDALRRLTKTTFPSNSFETYGYDNVGNQTSKTDRDNHTITYTYDQLNRFSQKIYPDSTNVTYTYDNGSRLTELSDSTGTYQFGYDNMGRLTNTTTNYSFLAGRSFVVSYGYDPTSNRTSLTDPESGVTSYVYDTLNRLQNLTPPTAYGSGSFGFSYDLLGRRTQLTRPNSVATTYSYDTLSRLLNITHKNGSTTLDGATYTLDKVGNRKTRQTLPSNTTLTYGYDAIYELLSAKQGTSTKETYTYDAVGNRLSALGSSGWTYSSSNDLSSRPGVTYTYDNNGNTLTKVDSTGTTRYAWDFENRLTSVTLPASGGTVSFKYDPFGRRIYKSSTASTSIYAYNGGNLIEETGATGTATARYTTGLKLDQPLAILQGTTVDYYHADGLGSITSMSNSSGAEAETYTYDSFGNLTASTGSVTNRFRYTGREFDSETNLYYYRARYYDSSAGRFLNEDPIGLNGGPNFYKYVANSPTNFVDPLGEQIGVQKGTDFNSVEIALIYLGTSPAADKIIQDLQNSPNVYLIDASDQVLKDSASPYNQIVYWKPHEGLCGYNGVQSPALQLLHELVHLWQAQDHQPFNGDAAENNDVQITNPAARQLGEPTRVNYADHQGDPILILPIPNK